MILNFVTQAFTIILLLICESIFLKACLVLLQMVVKAINENEIFGAWLLTLVLALSVIIVLALAYTMWGMMA